MSESDGDGLDHLSFSQRYGATINKKGGYYHPSKQYASSLAETKTATRMMRLAASGASHRHVKEKQEARKLIVLAMTVKWEKNAE